MSKKYKLIYSNDLFANRQELELTDSMHVDYVPMQANTLLQLTEIDTSSASARPVSDVLLQRVGKDLSVTLGAQSTVPSPTLLLGNFFHVVPVGAQPFVQQAHSGSTTPLVASGDDLTQAQALQKLATGQSVNLQSDVTATADAAQNVEGAVATQAILPAPMPPIHMLPESEGVLPEATFTLDPNTTTAPSEVPAEVFTPDQAVIHTIDPSTTAAPSLAAAATVHPAVMLPIYQFPAGEGLLPEASFTLDPNTTTAPSEVPAEVFTPDQAEIFTLDPNTTTAPSEVPAEVFTPDQAEIFMLDPNTTTAPSEVPAEVFTPDQAVIHTIDPSTTAAPSLAAAATVHPAVMLPIYQFPAGEGLLPEATFTLDPNTTTAPSEVPAEVFTPDQAEIFMLDPNTTTAPSEVPAEVFTPDQAEIFTLDPNTTTAPSEVPAEVFTPDQAVIHTIDPSTTAAPSLAAAATAHPAVMLPIYQFPAGEGLLPEATFTLDPNTTTAPSEVPAEVFTPDQANILAVLSQSASALIQSKPFTLSAEPLFELDLPVLTESSMSKPFKLNLTDVLLAPADGVTQPVLQVNGEPVSGNTLNLSNLFGADAAPTQLSSTGTVQLDGQAFTYHVDATLQAMIDLQQAAVV